MDFSIIIASRNRPVLVREAIQSVLAQTHPSFEIILVNDGSDGEHAAAYAAIRQELPATARFFDIQHTRKGHGQSYALNRGAELAHGTFLCFLDDDDFWTDPGHLARAWAAFAAAGSQTEVYLANQKAYLSGVLINEPLWLETLEQHLKARSAPAHDGVYAVSVEDLMACTGFGHLNTSIVKRGLFERIGGLDENIRYENDRDFFLRHVDQARGILYSPRFVSHHNAPDPSKALNMSTTVSYLEKTLFRTYVWNKARLFCASPAIREAATRGKGDTLRQIAIRLLADGRPAAAFHFALEALGARFSFKWLAYCGYLALRAAVGGQQH